METAELSEEPVAARWAFAAGTDVTQGRLLRETHGKGLLKTAITDFIEIRIPPVHSRGVSDELPADATGLVEEGSPEALEELIPLFEIQPLPPLPVEEGLEMLPPAEDAGKAKIAAGEAASIMGSDELRGPVHGGEMEPEELEEARTPSGRVQALPPSQEPAEIEELESVEEEVEEIPAAAGARSIDAERENELEALSRSGVVKAWTIDDLSKLVEEGKSAIVMEDGVFRIKEEVYMAGERARALREGSHLREIAEEVVRHDEKEGAEPSAPAQPAEEPGTGGIGDLLRDEDILDLSKVVSGEKGAAPEEALTVDREKTNPLKLKRTGLDYDEFLSSYPRSFTHTTQMKSLVEVSRRVSAVSACLIIKKVQVFSPDLTVGLSDKSVRALVFETQEPFAAEFLQTRKAVTINRNPAEVRFLGTRFDQEDLRYMKRVLFIPAVFRSQEAFLFLSFSGETDIAMNVILSKLIVR
jgi:hypothetical protein